MDRYVAAYWIVMAAVAVFVIARGGAPERWGVGAYIAGSMVMLAEGLAPGAIYHHVELFALAVDVAMAGAFGLLGLRANRRCPLAACGFQLLAVFGHFAKAGLPGVSRAVYALMTGFWSYPVMLALVIATVRHRRRLREFGVDQPWLTSFVPSARAMPTA